jgi:hypothetical protein
VLVVRNKELGAAMIVIPAVVNNERVQGITDNTLKALEQLTQDFIAEKTNGGEKRESK